MSVETVRDYYNNNVESEWERLEQNPYEFRINKYFMDKYIKPGDKVLDVGGGPGRYSLFFAQKGCDVTLLDLSDGNVEFAKQKAKERGLTIRAILGNACETDKILNERFDHVLLMGPLYHLLEDSDRRRAVAGCLNVLKPNGILFASFISAVADIIYLLQENPGMIGTGEFKDLTYFIEDRPFSGSGFTEARFERIRDIEPFMNGFGLEKLHLLGSEGILAPFKYQILKQPPEVLDRCIDLAIKVCEREELLVYSEHLLYIGRKRS